MRLRPRFSPLFALCSAVLLASVLLPLPAQGAILGLPSICPFHNLTGLPCPGCGLTRAFVCCAHGQLLAALGYHPLGPALFGATLFFGLNALLGRETPRIPNRFLWLATLIFGACWALRLGGVFASP